MDYHHEDQFTLYVRTDPMHVARMEEIEQPLGSFACYEDALRAQRAYQLPIRDCVIRFNGDSGGGD